MINWKYTILGFSFYLFISPSIIIAQSISHVGHIGSEDGLTSQLCTNIVEDNLGNLWISSFQDVQKYTGYSIKVLPSKDLNSIENSLLDLFKDSAGFIWIIKGKSISIDTDRAWNVSIENCNISVINPHNDSVSSLREYINSDILDNEDIIKYYAYPEKIFFVTASNKVYAFNNKLFLYTEIRNAQNVLTITDQGEIVEFSSDILTIKNSNGELLFQINSNSLSEKAAFLPTESGTLCLLEESEDKILISKFKDTSFIDLTTLDKKLFLREELQYSKIQFINDELLLIDGKLHIINQDGGYEIIEFIGSKNVNDFQVAETGLCYAATNLGVFVLSSKKELFKKIGYYEATQNSVRGFFINDNIIAHKIFDHEVIASRSNKNNFTFLNSHDLGYMAFLHYQDPLNENHLWSSGYIPGKIRKIDFENRKVEYFDFIPTTQSGTSSILRSSTSSIMYVCTDDGLYFLDDDDQILKNVELNLYSTKPIEANHLIEKSGEIWIASSAGVIRYIEKEDRSILEEIFTNSQQFTIQFIHQDKINHDLIWLGTRRGGLVKWNIETDSIKVFNTENGLSNNDVHAIIEDNSERLWISTNRNLNCFDKKTEKNYVFTTQDGLSNPEFNKHSYFLDEKNNQIYFGGLNGYNYFNPDSISTSSVENKIKVRIIDAIKTKDDGHIENIFTKTLTTNSINIEQQDVSIQLNLSTNYLFDSDKTQYSYRIPSLADKWETQSSNNLRLNRLPYGNYKLEIISDLNKPSITSNILVIDLKVIQPFTRTWTFYFLCVLTFLYLAWIAIQKYNKNILERNLKLEETIKTRTQELRESNKTKNKIFTILAHDLRQPISSLTNLTEKIKFLSKHNRMDELDILAVQTKSRINSLNDNLNNILLWALNENDEFTLTPKQVPLLHEINNTLNIYIHQLKEKKIETQLLLNEHDEVFVDLVLLQLILRNFITNAIKFSFHGGSIIFSKSFEDEKKLELEIKDNGIGILQKSQSDPNISNQRIRNEGKGSGIGLLISKDLAEKSNIGLRIESEISKGTSIYIMIPKV